MVMTLEHTLEDKVTINYFNTLKLKIPRIIQTGLQVELLQPQYLESFILYRIYGTLLSATNYDKSQSSSPSCKTIYYVKLMLSLDT